MPSPHWTDDEQLMGDLREALRPVPGTDEIIDAALAAFAWRTVEADLALAALLYDSDLDQALLVRAQLSSSPRTLTFGHGELRVDVEVSEAGIQGQLIPPAPGTVRLVAADGGSAEVSTDEVGCFSFPAQRHRAIRLTCDAAGGRFATEWIMT
jgi:hypothetical protein